MGHVWFQVLPGARDEDPRLTLQQALMRRRIEKYPADFVAHFNFGAALQAQGALDQALPYLERAVQIRPRYAIARNNLALSLFAVERFEAAVYDFVGRVFGSQGQFQSALPHFRKATVLQPNNAAFQTNLGAALASVGDLPAAAVAFERALAIDPSSEAARSLSE